MTNDALILRWATRALYPLMLAVSIWVLLRGHNAPGGGFIGGMIAVAATALVAAAQGCGAAMGRWPFGAFGAAGVACGGVLLSLLSGFGGPIAGLPYMTHLWADLPLGFTRLPVSTVMLFDLGVYLAVWGGLGGVAAALLALDDEEPAA